MNGRLDAALCAVWGIAVLAGFIAAAWLLMAGFVLVLVMS